MGLKVMMLVLSAVLATPVSAACYSVYDGARALVYRSQDSPVDLTRHIGDVVPERFGGGAAMVVDVEGGDCVPAGAAQALNALEPLSAFDDPLAQLEEITAGGSWPSVGGGVYASSYGRRPAALGYPYVGPRGGRYRITSGGNKAYAPRRR